MHDAREANFLHYIQIIENNWPPHCCRGYVLFSETYSKRSHGMIPSKLIHNKLGSVSDICWNEALAIQLSSTLIPLYPTHIQSESFREVQSFAPQLQGEEQFGSLKQTKTKISVTCFSLPSELLFVIVTGTFVRCSSTECMSIFGCGSFSILSCSWMKYGLFRSGENGIRAYAFLSKFRRLELFLVSSSSSKSLPKRQACSREQCPSRNR